VEHDISHAQILVWTITSSFALIVVLGGALAWYLRTVTDRLIKAMDVQMERLVDLKKQFSDQLIIDHVPRAIFNEFQAEIRREIYDIRFEQGKNSGLIAGLRRTSHHDARENDGG
jgi:hypothetical protein